MDFKSVSAAVAFSSIVFFSSLLGVFVSHEINNFAERGGDLRKEIVLSLELLDFMQTGGGPAGTVENYFAWAYAKKILSPRPWWHHVLFPSWLAFQPLGYWIIPNPEKEFHHPKLVSFIKKGEKQ